jgi:hypothetical protein
MPSEAFHRTTDGRVQEITAGVQFEPLNLESSDLVNQEIYREGSCNNPHTDQAKIKISELAADDRAIMQRTHSRSNPTRSPSS